MIDDLWSDAALPGERDATGKELSVFEKAFDSGKYDYIYKECDPELNPGEQFDAGDWTTSELKKAFPTKWQMWDEVRKKRQNADPVWYANAIEAQREEEQALD